MPNNQKGVSLIITFFIMIIMLAVVLSVSLILYSEIKIVRNISNSVVSFYAADSGIEKVLFYDWQVLPIIGTGLGGEAVYSQRGLCAMVSYDQDKNPSACFSSVDGASACKDSSFTAKDAELNGCDWKVCDNCTIKFKTEFDKREYRVEATVAPGNDDTVDFDIYSWGGYSLASRQVKVKLKGKESRGAFTIKNACANPVSSAEGDEVEISICVKSNVGAIVFGGQAFIYSQEPAPTTPTIDLVQIINSADSDCNIPGDAGYEKLEASWHAPAGDAQTYYVDLFIWDTTGETPETSNNRRIEKLEPYPLCIYPS